MTKYNKWRFLTKRFFLFIDWFSIVNEHIISKYESKSFMNLFECFLIIEIVKKLLLITLCGKNYWDCSPLKSSSKRMDWFELICIEGIDCCKNHLIVVLFHCLLLLLLILLIWIMICFLSYFFSYHWYCTITIITKIFILYL